MALKSEMRLPAMSLKIASEPKPPGKLAWLHECRSPEANRLVEVGLQIVNAYGDGGSVGRHALHVLEDAAADAVSAVAIRFRLHEAVWNAIGHRHGVDLPVEHPSVEVFESLRVVATELEVNRPAGRRSLAAFPHSSETASSRDRLHCGQGRRT